MKKLILLPLFLLSLMLGAAEEQLSFTQSWGSAEFNGFVRVFRSSRKFVRQIKNLKNAKYKLTLKVSATDPKATVGAKIKFFMTKGAPILKHSFWKRKSSEKVVTIEFSGDLKEVREMERIVSFYLLIYNCNSKGSLKVESVDLTVSGEKNKVKIADDKPKKAAKKIVNTGKVPNKKLDVQTTFFPAGVYYYGKGYDLARFEKVFKDIVAHNCNSVYLAYSMGDTEKFRKICELAEKYGLKVFAQGSGSLYLRPEMGDAYYETTTLARHRSVFPKLKGIQNFSGLTVKEEVDPSDDAIAMMQKARENQRKLLPEVPVFTLHNRLPSMAMDDDPQKQPDIYAFDMYRFKLHPRKVVMTPSKAANRITTNLEIAYVHTMGFGKPLIFVAQGVRALVTVKDKNYTRASGFKEIAPGVWKGWFRYMPKYAMPFQFWLGVMSGCRGFLVYHYQAGAESSEKGLVSADHKESPYWKEMGECLGEAKPLFPLFASWYKTDLDRAVKSNVKTVFVRQFTHPDFKGRFVLPVNTLIARWDRNNPRLVNAKTQLRFGEENLEGFTPVGNQKFALQLAARDTLYDLLSGKKADPANLELAPGQGRVYFQGSAAELAKVRKFLKL